MKRRSRCRIPEYRKIRVRVKMQTIIDRIGKAVNCVKLWMEKGEGEEEGKLNSMIMIVLKFYEYFKDLNWKRIKCIISLDIDKSDNTSLSSLYSRKNTKSIYKLWKENTHQNIYSNLQIIITFHNTNKFNKTAFLHPATLISTISMTPIRYSIYGRIVLLDTCLPLLTHNKKMMGIVSGLGVVAGGINTGKAVQ